MAKSARHVELNYKDWGSFSSCWSVTEASSDETAVLLTNISFQSLYIYIGETGASCNTFFTLANFSKPIQSMQTTNISFKSTSFGLISTIISLLWHIYK